MLHLVGVLLAIVLTGVWLTLAVRERQHEPGSLPRRGSVALGVSAAVTVFLAWPIEHRGTLSLGNETEVWAAFWVILASAMRFVAFLVTTSSRTLHRSGPNRQDSADPTPESGQVRWVLRECRVSSIAESACALRTAKPSQSLLK